MTIRVDADELLGEAKEEADLIIANWKDRPVVAAWPDGTEIVRGADVGYTRGWEAEKHWIVRVPSGGCYVFFPQSEHRAPEVLWSYMIERSGSVVAFPRVANTDVIAADDMAKTKLRRGGALGLQEMYVIGQLSERVIDLAPELHAIIGVLDFDPAYARVATRYGFQSHRDRVLAKLKGDK